ncbi:LacI family DNA-binding transcriptional regulator [Calidifontibacter indicus]|uniref:LacI family DNA-binding transcriptional regulator n=1 Tax=Calidifontibacter indicus TaxID=419650 RepID=UPI003D75859A
MARLAEIAAHAGVSEATVSRVLNDKGNVSDATRETVLTSVDVLGYERPSNLRRHAVGLVGIIVPELTNPVFAMFAQTLQGRFSAHDYTSVVCTQAPGGTQEEEYLQMLQDRGVAGVVFVSGRHADTTADIAHYQRLAERGLPIVVVNGYREEIDAPSVSTNEAAAVRIALNHLRQLGHQRIGLATGQSRYLPSMCKVAEFRAQVAEFDTDEPVIEQTWFSVEGGELAGRRLLERGVTAVICGSDMMALGVVKAVEQQGLSVPSDVSVIGYDGWLLTQHTSPALTTVRQDLNGLSAAIVHALTEEIAGRRHPRGDLLFDPELVVRASTAPARPGAAKRP